MQPYAAQPARQASTSGDQRRLRFARDRSGKRVMEIDFIATLVRKSDCRITSIVSIFRADDILNLAC
jgi:hypothetical protein